MKTSFYLFVRSYSLLQKTLYSCLLAALITACKTEETLPIEALYRLDNLSTLKLDTLPKRHYFIGIDQGPVTLTTKAYEQDGTVIEMPAGAIDFFANDQPLSGNVFTPTQPGKIVLKGSLAGKWSNAVEIQVWDVSLLHIELNVANPSPEGFLANGADTVSLRARLMNGEEVVPGNFPITISASSGRFAKPFTTTTPGDYKFVAEGIGLKSNEVSVRMIAPPVYELIRVPVIFHEVNRSNLTGERIRAFTEAMTRAYRNRQNPLQANKSTKSTDLYIEFFPATTGTDGKLLTIPGLDRVSTQRLSFTQEQVTQDAFNHFWNPEQVVNVWVYPNITGEYSDFSWAYFPFVTQPKEGFNVIAQKTAPFFPYGIFLNEAHLDNGPEDILTHEAGHMFGLAHVFNGDGNNHNGCAGGDPDFCSDTPFYDRGNYSSTMPANQNLRYNRISCGGDRYTATNFMDYYYSYNNSFTVDQSERARHTVDYGLWLPTPFNGARNLRTSGTISKVERPANIRYVKPVICARP